MGKDDSRFAFLREPRVRRALALGGGAFALAGVVFAGAALSVPRQSEAPRKVVTSLSPVAESQRLIGEAEKALASDETTKAKDLLRQALALDPSSEKAGELLDEVDDDTGSSEQTTSANSTSAPTDGAGPGGGSPAVDDSAFEVKVDVKSLLPSAIPGYAMGTVVAESADAVVTAEPQPASEAFRKLVRVLLTVRDRGSSSSADKFVTDVSKRLYAQGAAEVSVSGTPAYFGTDGKRLATVVFVRGRYVFEVLATADTVTASELQPYLLTVAGTFPGTPE